MGQGGGGDAGEVGKGQTLAETHNQLIHLLEENVNMEITAWNLPLGDKLWLPAAKALERNTACKRLTIYGCDIGPEGATALADALHVNTTLEAIDYNDNRMSWAGLRKISAAWAKTRSEAARNTIATGGKWSASEVYKKPEVAKKAAEVLFVPSPNMQAARSVKEDDVRVCCICARLWVIYLFYGRIEDSGPSRTSPNSVVIYMAEDISRAVSAPCG